MLLPGPDKEPHYAYIVVRYDVLVEKWVALQSKVNDHLRFQLIVLQQCILRFLVVIFILIAQLL